MKKCTYCGKEYGGDQTNCLVDGEPLLDPDIPPLPAGPAVKRLGWFEEQFASTSRATLVIATFLLAVVVFGAGILGLIFCKSEKARGNAAFATAISAGFMVAGGILIALLRVV